MRIRTERFKTLVILDEVHHAGDALSWGEAVREAFQPAHAAARADRNAVPLRRQPDPLRDLRARVPSRDRAPWSPCRLHLRLRPRAGRPRRAAGALHGLLRRHAVAHPGRRRGRRPAGRAADQGPVRPGAAHRPRSRRRVDGRRARGGRPPALRGTPARARRRRPGHRDRPGRRACLRRPAQADHRREADPGALRREGRLEADRRLHLRRPALDGRGADGLRGRRRATARGRASTPRRPPRPLFFAQAVGRFVRARRRGETAIGVPAVGRRPARVSPPRWSSSAITCWAAPISNEDDIFAAEADLLARAQAGEERLRRGARGCPSRPSGRRRRFDHVLFDGATFGHAGEVHVGSEEEMDFLGIPGLLEPDQVRDLLAHRQSERAASGVRPAASTSGRSSARSPPTSSWRCCAASSTGSSRPGTTAPARRTASPTPRCARSAADRPRPSRPPTSCTRASSASASGPCAPEPGPDGDH